MKLLLGISILILAMVAGSQQYIGALINSGSGWVPWTATLSGGQSFPTPQQFALLCQASAGAAWQACNPGSGGISVGTAGQLQMVGATAGSFAASAVTDNGTTVTSSEPVSIVGGSAAIPFAVSDLNGLVVTFTAASGGGNASVNQEFFKGATQEWKIGTNNAQTTYSFSDVVNSIVSFGATQGGATQLNSESTSPINLNTFTNSGTGGVTFGSGGSSPSTVATIDSAGTFHYLGAAPSPSAGSIGTNSTNAGGSVTGLSAATSLTITFANGGWTNSAFRTISPGESLATPPYISAITKSAFTITSVAITGTIYYTCTGS